METKAVAICLITYNHVRYIQQAIEGVLMQKTGFSWELIIADDCSTDGTREILLEYKNKYPDRIRLLLQKKNIGPSENWCQLITSPTSRYIAYFEGDDYWINPRKLQMQYDLMEANPTYSLCFHNATILTEGTNTTTPFRTYNRTEYSGKDILREWIIPTASVFFRNVLPKDLPSFIRHATHGDLALFLYLSGFGKLACINETMSVYRIHPSGATQSVLKGIKHNTDHIQQLELMIDYFGPLYKKELETRMVGYLVSTANLYAREGNKKLARQYLVKAFTINKAESVRNSKDFLAAIYRLVK